MLDFSKNLYTAISFGTNYGLGEQCDSCYLYIVDNIKNTADNCMLEEMTVYCTNGQIKANEIIFDKPFATLSLKDIKPEVYIVDNVFKNNRQIKQEGVFMFVKKGIFINQTLLWPRYKTRNKGNLCYADISASNFKKLKSVRELLK